MRIHIRHVTRYRYSQAVALLPHLLQFRPREDAFQRLAAFSLQVNPCQRHTALLDGEGNCPSRAWFNGQSSSLEIKAEGVVEVQRENPFDYLMEPEALRLPLKARAFPGVPPAALGPRRKAGPGVAKLASRLLVECGGDTAAYLMAAARACSTQIKRVTREDGAPWAPEETLRKGQGSCRDLSLLYMDLARAQGLPARFVSGYFLEHPNRRHHELHAWAEVWLPGGGWRGFDPSMGLACASLHVAVAASADPALCAPVQGSFRGSARAKLEALVELKAA